MSVVARVFSRAIRIWRFHQRKQEARKLGIVYIEPNYIYLDVFDSSSVIIDVGCGYDADFFVHLIDKYCLRAFGVDPTLKHANSLQAIEKRTKGKFKH